MNLRTEVECPAHFYLTSRPDCPLCVAVERSREVEEGGGIERVGELEDENERLKWDLEDMTRERDELLFKLRDYEELA